MTYNRVIPGYARAVIETLCISRPRGSLAVRLSDAEWKKALSFSDRSNLTLPLSQSVPAFAPEWVRERLAQNLSNTVIRWARIKQTYREIATALGRSGVECLVLKGFAQCPDFVSYPTLRQQSDIDLLLPMRDVPLARDVVLQLGYEPIGKDQDARTDHLPTMIRKTGWEWRGEYFDPDIPISVDLHFRLWDKDTEGFRVSGLTLFWDRRIRRELDELSFVSLARQDALSYSCLHALRHLLRGDLRPSHIYEIALFLEQSRADHPFWDSWYAMHDESLRRPQAICFALARIWFNCRPHPIAYEEQERLSHNVRQWLSQFPDSPITTLFKPNKDELWLHVCLLNSTWARIGVLRRRLIPGSLPGPIDSVHLPRSQRTWKTEIMCRLRYIWYLIVRAVYHLRALLPTMLSGIRLSFGR